MKRASLLAAAAITLVGCSEPPSSSSDTPPDPRAAAEVGPAESLPRTLPPPSTTTPRYVGLWAASADGCAAAPWRWEANSVTTQGEVSCTFNQVNATPAGYGIEASCTAEAPPSPYQIELVFAESARAMMVSGGPWSAPISLVYCGPP